MTDDEMNNFARDIEQHFATAVTTARGALVGPDGGRREREDELEETFFAGEEVVDLVAAYDEMVEKYGANADALDVLYRAVRIAFDLDHVRPGRLRKLTGWLAARRG